MNSDSIITTAVLPPTALGTPLAQPVVAAVQVKQPGPAPQTVAPPAAVAPVAVKPRKQPKRQASSAARA